MAKKILIVEDESIIGIDIAAKLEKNGYKVTGLAVDDIETLSCIADNMPDLILMDISLKSNTDGIELAKNIQLKYSIPVIYLTSYSDTDTITRSMETTPYGYIIKPFTTQTLLTTIRLALIRVELEKNLIEKNELLQNILDSTLDGIAVIDENKKLLMQNKAFERIVGSSGDRIIDTLMEDVSFDCRLHSMKCVDTPLGHKNLLVSACQFSNGHIITVTDITAIETFKTALDNAEKKFSTIFRKKLIPAVLVTSPDCIIYDANERFIKLYKKDSGIFGKPLSDFIGSDVLKMILETVEQEDSFEIYRVIQTKGDGSSFYADFRGNLIDFDGNSYFLIDIEDVSKKVAVENMEKELKIQMIQNNKMTALGTLVSGVAHELNNPNNFIMFNSSLMQDYLDDIFSLLDTVAEREPGLKIGNFDYEEAKCDLLQLLNGSIKGSERIRDIVLDLKGFARQDMPLNKSRINISAPMQSAVRILKHKINKTTDNFNLTAEKNLPDISGNTQKLEQVFINLIVNALESLTSKSKAVSISIYSENDKVITEICDEGTGISEHVIQRITEPFFTTKQSSGGTGLGLSIAYSIISEHDGKMEITSEEGSGTKVKIILPAVK